MYQNAFDRAQNDAIFLEAVRSRYAGNWDVVNALWWESHPTEISPSGIHPPSTQLAELQRRVFSENGDASGDEIAAQALNDLQLQIQFERRAINDAIEMALQGPIASMPTSARPSMINVSEQEHESSPDANPQTVSGRKRLAILACAAALIIGVIAGAQLSLGIVEAAPATATSSPTASAPRIAAFAVFDRPQQLEDVPALVLPKTFDIDSFRALDGAGSSNPSAVPTMFAARNSSNMVCLVVLSSKVDYLSTCVPESEFPTTGLRLGWPYDVDYEDSDGQSSTITTDSITVWKPDASIQSGGPGR